MVKFQCITPEEMKQEKDTRGRKPKPENAQTWDVDYSQYPVLTAAQYERLLIGIVLGKA